MSAASASEQDTDSAAELPKGEPIGKFGKDETLESILKRIAGHFWNAAKAKAQSKVQESLTLRNYWPSQKILKTRRSLSKLTSVGRRAGTGLLWDATSVWWIVRLVLGVDLMDSFDFVGCRNMGPLMRSAMLAISVLFGSYVTRIVAYRTMWQHASAIHTRAKVGVFIVSGLVLAFWVYMMSVEAHIELVGKALNGAVILFMIRNVGKHLAIRKQVK